MPEQTTEETALEILVAATCVNAGKKLERWEGPFGGDPSIPLPRSMDREAVRGIISTEDLDVPS